MENSVYLTFEVEPWWSEPGVGSKVFLHEPRLVLYDNGDQGQTEVAAIPLSEIFEAWDDWERNKDDFGL